MRLANPFQEIAGIRLIASTTRFIMGLVVEAFLCLITGRVKSHLRGEVWFR
jgi:hypothetical protein